MDTKNTNPHPAETAPAGIFAPLFDFLLQKTPGLIKTALYLGLAYVALVVDIAPCTGQCSYYRHGHCANNAFCQSQSSDFWFGSDSTCAGAWAQYTAFCWGFVGCSTGTLEPCQCYVLPPTDSLSVGAAVTCVNESGGWCRDGASVTFTGTDGASHPVTISGTIGSTGFNCGTTNPCTQGLPEGSGTITYGATCTGGLSAGPNTTTWQLDLTPPIVNYTLDRPTPDGLAGWYLGGSVNMTCTGSDPAGGSGWAGITYGSPTASGDGWNLPLSCTGSDVAGNTASTGTTINIDGTAPVPSLSCNGLVCGAGWYTTAVTVTAGASDLTSGVAPGSALVSVDGGGWVASANVPEGTHTVQSRAFDNAGNSATTAPATILVDTVNPAATFMCNGIACDSSWYTGAVAVSLSATDAAPGSGVFPGSAEVSIDGGPWVASSLLTADGSYNVDGHATDNAGNTTTTSWVVQIDNTGPVVTGTLSGGTMGGGGIYLNGPVTLSCTATDATSGVATITYGTQTATAGTTTLSCTATDNAGNTTTHSEIVNIDSVLPDGSFAFNGTYCNGGWYNSPVYVSMVTSDNGGGALTSLFQVDGQDWTSGQAVMDGIHALTGFVSDLAGNVRNISDTLQVDTYPPMSSFITENDSWVGGSISLEGQSIDWTSGIALVEISMDDGATWIPIGSSTNWSYEWNTAAPGATVPDGTYTIMARALDNACNQEHTGYVTVNVDNTPPDLSLQDSLVVLGNTTAFSAADAGSGVDKAKVTISGNGIEPRVLEFASSGGKTSMDWDGRDGNGEVAPFGIYDVMVEVWDKVGNYSKTTGTWVRPKPEAPAPIIEPTSMPPIDGNTVPPDDIKPDPNPDAGLPKALPFWSLVLPLGALGVWLAGSNIAIARDRRWSELRGIRRTVARYRDQNKINFPQEGEE